MAELRSRDVIEALLAVSEGEIEGLENGKASFFLGDTPLQNPDTGENNFADFEVIERKGLPDDGPVNFRLGGTASSTNVATQLKPNQPIVRQTQDGNFDRIQIRLNISRLIDSSGKNPSGSKVDFKIEFKGESESSFRPVGDTTRDGETVFRVKGKAQSPTVKEVGFNKPDSIQEPVVIRITQLDAGTSKVFKDVSWESYQTIITDPDQPKRYPNTAMVQVIGRATGQFRTIPNMTGNYKGRIVQVPDNYDPINRTLSGTWGGVFKRAWTNNPAWVLYDFITNTRFGIASFYPNIRADKFDFLEAAKWCDEPIQVNPDDPNDDRTQPRFTFNGFIQEAQDGRDLLRFIAGTFNGVPFDDRNGTIHLKLDRKDQQPVALFAPENVQDGIFEYQYTDVTTRHNDVSVKFTDPQLNWKQNVRRIFDPSHLERFGSIPLEFEAVGCIDEQEAVRRAKYKLFTALTETEQVSFTTNRQGTFVDVFDIILVSDPDMEYGISGRIKNYFGDIVELDKPVFLESGVDYTFRIKVVGQDEVFETRLEGNDPGEVSIITLADPLPSEGVPARQVFSLESPGATPKPYRVMQISEGDNPDNITINAAEINRAKWTEIDNPNTGPNGEVDVVDDTQKTTPFNGTPFPSAPTNLELTPEVITGPNSQVTNLVISWDKLPSPFFDEFIVEHSFNQNPEQQVARTTATEATIQNVPDGFHRVIVRAVGTDTNGQERASQPVEATINIGQETQLDNVAVNGLEVDGSGNGATFFSRSPKFQWRAVSDGGSFEIGSEPLGANSGFMDGIFRDFQIEIRDPETNEVVFEDNTTNLSYTFDFDSNANAPGGPYRSFIFSVAIRDTFNRLSKPAEITVSNPAPSLPAEVRANVIAQQVTVEAGLPIGGEPDVQGMMVWMSTEEDPEVSDENLVYDGSDLITPPLDAPGSANRFLKVALKDSYSSSSLNVTRAFPAEITRAFQPVNLRARPSTGGAELVWDVEDDPAWTLTDVYVQRIPKGSSFDPAWDFARQFPPVGRTKGDHFQLNFRRLGRAETHAEFLDEATQELTDDQFINKMYLVWLDREPFGREKNFWRSRLNAVNRPSIEREFINNQREVSVGEQVQTTVVVDDSTKDEVDVAPGIYAKIVSQSTNNPTINIQGFGGAETAAVGEDRAINVEGSSRDFQVGASGNVLWVENKETGVTRLRLSMNNVGERVVFSDGGDVPNISLINGDLSVEFGGITFGSGSTVESVDGSQLALSDPPYPEDAFPPLMPPVEFSDEELIRRFFRNYLGELSPEQEKVNFWLEEVAKRQNTRSVTRQKFLDVAVENKPSFGDEEFVTQLFDLYLDRAPTDAELTTWTGASVADGDIFRAWVRSVNFEGIPGKASLPIDVKTDGASTGEDNPLNLGFELGPTGWVTNGNWEIVKNSSGARGGEWAAKFTGEGGAALVNETEFTVRPDEQVVVQAMIKKVSGPGEAFVESDVKDSDGNIIKTHTGDARSGGAYERSRAVVLPDGGVTVSLKIRVRNAGSDTVIFADDTSFQTTALDNGGGSTSTTGFPYINVRKNGAKGDGITDDLPVIQDALDAAFNEGIKGIYIPWSSKPYFIDGTLSFNGPDGTPYSGLEVLGGGRETFGEVQLDVLSLTRDSSNPEKFFIEVNNPEQIDLGNLFEADPLNLAKMEYDANIGVYEFIDYDPSTQTIIALNRREGAQAEPNPPKDAIMFVDMFIGGSILSWRALDGRKSTHQSTMIHGKACQNVRLKDMGVTGPGVNEVFANGIIFERDPDSAPSRGGGKAIQGYDFDNISVRHMPGTGVWMGQVIFSQFRGMRISTCALDGLKFAATGGTSGSTTSIVVDACFITGTRRGIIFEVGAYVTLNSNVVESSNIGIFCDFMRNVSLNGQGFETIKQRPNNGSFGWNMVLRRANGWSINGTSIFYNTEFDENSNGIMLLQSQVGMPAGGVHNSHFHRSTGPLVPVVGSRYDSTDAYVLVDPSKDAGYEPATANSPSQWLDNGTYWKVGRQVGIWNTNRDEVFFGRHKIKNIETPPFDPTNTTLMAAPPDEADNGDQGFSVLDTATVYNLVALTRGMNTPPSDPGLGDVHIIGTDPTLDWAKHPKEIATLVEREFWRKDDPDEGDLILVEDTGEIVAWDGTQWGSPVATRSVISRSKIDPPKSPATGDSYIVLAGASGAWSGHESDIATWTGGSWDFDTAGLKNDLVSIEDEGGQIVAWNGTDWVTHTLSVISRTHDLAPSSVNLGSKWIIPSSVPQKKPDGTDNPWFGFENYKVEWDVTAPFWSFNSPGGATVSDATVKVEDEPGVAVAYRTSMASSTGTVQASAASGSNTISIGGFDITPAINDMVDLTDSSGTTKRERIVDVIDSDTYEIFGSLDSDYQSGDIAVLHRGGWTETAGFTNRYIAVDMTSTVGTWRKVEELRTINIPRRLSNSSFGYSPGPGFATRVGRNPGPDIANGMCHRVYEAETVSTGRMKAVLDPEIRFPTKYNFKIVWSDDSAVDESEWNNLWPQMKNIGIEDHNATTYVKLNLSLRPIFGSGSKAESNFPYTDSLEPAFSGMTLSSSVLGNPEIVIEPAFFRTNSQESSVDLLVPAEQFFPVDEEVQISNLKYATLDGRYTVDEGTPVLTTKTPEPAVGIECLLTPSNSVPAEPAPMARDLEFGQATLASDNKGIQTWLNVSGSDYSMIHDFENRINIHDDVFFADVTEAENYPDANHYNWVALNGSVSEVTVNGVVASGDGLLGKRKKKLDFLIEQRFNDWQVESIQNAQAV